MSDLLEWTDEAVACQDPDCAEANAPELTAEPDGEGDLRWHACNVCGYEFNWNRVPQDVISMDEHGSCSVGIPEEIRRAASQGMERAMAQEAKSQPPLLQIGRRPA